MIVDYWNRFVDHQLPRVDRRQAFDGLYKEVFPLFNREVNNWVNKNKVFLQSSDLIQDFAENLYRRSFREDLNQLPIFQYPGQVVNYTKKFLIRFLNKKPRVWFNNNLPVAGVDDINDLGDFNSSTSTTSNLIALELNGIFDRFKKIHKFCAELIWRWHISHQGISYQELKQEFPGEIEDNEYGGISPDALKQRNADCLNRLKSFYIKRLI